MRKELLKIIVKKCIPFFLIIAITIPFFAPVYPVTKKAEALAVEDALVQHWTALSAIANTASAIANKAAAAAQASLVLKEWTLDGIAFGLINLIIKQISRSIILWINSGFQGSPAFVTDLKGFMLDIADQEAGKFLKELGLGFLCSPFRLEVTLALALQYKRARNYENQCRLSEVVTNIENFFNGDLGSGGWGAWFQLTNVPANNPYGALVAAETELAIRIRNSQGEYYNLLEYGRGFLPFKECKPVEGATPDCGITNPGAVIETQLNATLGLPAQRLVVADEINEILGALFSQLVVQAFTGVGGLLGLTSSAYSSSGQSYLDAATIQNENRNFGFQDNSNNPIGMAISDERSYISIQTRVISMITDAENYDIQTYRENCSSAPLPGNLSTLRSEATLGIAKADAFIAQLGALNLTYQETKDPQVQLDTMDAFLALRSTGQLHDATETGNIEYIVIGTQTRGLVADLSVYRSQVDTQCREYFEDRRRNSNDNSSNFSPSGS